MKNLLVILLFLVIGNGVGFSQSEDSLVCTFNGKGMDPVYTIHAFLGQTLLFEAPMDIEKVFIGDSANWLTTFKGKLLWIQPKLQSIRTTIFIVTKAISEGSGRLVFGFQLMEKSLDTTADVYSKVVILQGVL